MATEYVEREGLRDALWDADAVTMRGIAIVNTFPAADVAPVRHGRWLKTDAFPHRVYCSECYATYVPNDNWQIWQDKPGEGGLQRTYCPACGAKMEEPKNDKS